MMSKLKWQRFLNAFASGSLMYAMFTTHPDISFAVGVGSKYMANPCKTHWEAVKNIMRYLNGIREMCTCFGRKDAFVYGYANADFTRNIDNRCSMI